jgi:ketosteroid isomerase-like protein
MIPDFVEESPTAALRTDPIGHRPDRLHYVTGERRIAWAGVRAFFGRFEPPFQGVRGPRNDETLTNMSESNVEIARRGFEAALAGEFETLRDLLAPDVKWHGGDPAAEDSCQNSDQAWRFIRRAFDLGFDGELVDVVGAGDQVVVILRPADGKPVANLTTFRDGKAVEMVHYPDPDDAFAAAGL